MTDVAELLQAAKRRADERGGDITADAQDRLHAIAGRIAASRARVPAESDCRALQDIVDRMVDLAPAPSGKGVAKPILGGAELDAALASFAFPGEPSPPVIGPKERGIEALKAASLFAGQFVTLATALLTFSLVFTQNFRPNNVNVSFADLPLGAAWVFLALTIFKGLHVTANAIDSLNNYDIDKKHQAGPYVDEIRNPAWWMVAFFAIAIAALTIAMIVTVLSQGYLPRAPTEPTGTR